MGPKRRSTRLNVGEDAGDRVQDTAISGSKRSSSSAVTPTTKRARTVTPKTATNKVPENLVAQVPEPDDFLNSFFSRENPAREVVSNTLVHTSSAGNAEDEEGSDSDEEEDWEELGTVQGSTLPAEPSSILVSGAQEEEGFEISVKRPEPDLAQEIAAKKAKARGIRKGDRIRRMLAHKVHLLCLLTCGFSRNRWCNNQDLQAIAASVVPPDIYNGITGKGSDANRKGKQPVTLRKKSLLYYLGMFAKWWKEQVTVQDVPDQKLQGPRSVLKQFGAYMEKHEEDAERTVSAEVSVLVFAAACRSLGLQTRVVYSLHPLPLSLSIQKKAAPPAPRKKKPKRKPARSAQTSDHDDEDVDPDTFVSRPSAPCARIEVPSGRQPNVTTVLVPYPLQCWCEVYSETDLEWIPVDPVRAIVNDPAKMEPSPSAPSQLQTSYVVAFEPDFGAKDVTRRYTTQWGARTMRLRLPPGPQGEDWWERSLWFYSKSGGGLEDRVEDEQLKTAGVKEKMPTSLAGFKDHPLYALERHLKKFEVIHPSGPEQAIGRYKDDLVYPRSHVKELHTAATWLKKGRMIKAGEEPMKHIKARVATIKRLRQIEMEKMDDRGRDREDESTDSSKSAVFGEWQTTEYLAPPLIDGQIPKNEFGNIEIFHKNMIPRGCIHLPLNGIRMIAKKLGIECASAVTGFEFHRGHSTPTINGIVVEAEFEDILTAAWEENQQRLRVQELQKTNRRVYGRWRKLIVSLLNKARLIKEYMIYDDEDEGTGTSVVEQSMDTSREVSEDDAHSDNDDRDSEEEEVTTFRRYTGKPRPRFVIEDTDTDIVDVPAGNDSRSTNRDLQHSDNIQSIGHGGFLLEDDDDEAGVSKSIGIQSTVHGGFLLEDGDDNAAAEGAGFFMDE
ncbi:hypothetical protein PhCBS80983_g00490 [Powellomyces hirtus]|uniref:Rad4 beta-hairpin domain-containing protein n=1 Tax=Powellomyces hirtus TaxID=109895 RepID=A0A507EDH8_9FUNG|nr:hypothetical protein PhCBS80983_g00490 [Powellomyces hirtus]